MFGRGRCKLEQSVALGSQKKLHPTGQLHKNSTKTPQKGHFVEFVEFLWSFVRMSKLSCTFLAFVEFVSSLWSFCGVFVEFCPQWVEFLWSCGVFVEFLWTSLDMPPQTPQ